MQKLLCNAGVAARISPRSLGWPRVLLVHGELAPRLALQTILQAGGYTVDVAASPAEAMLKLDEDRYELVLTDNRFGSDVQACACQNIGQQPPS